MPSWSRRERWKEGSKFKAQGKHLTLLAWRAELILSGWNRAVLQTGAVRPDVLFHLETRVESIVRTGVGDRVLEVLAALAERPVTLESLVVLDDHSHLLARLGGGGEFLGELAEFLDDFLQESGVGRVGCQGSRFSVQ